MSGDTLVNHWDSYLTDQGCLLAEHTLQNFFMDLTLFLYWRLTDTFSVETLWLGV